MKMYQIGDLLRLRKKHPCGDDRWEVLKAGVDMRIKCVTCERIILIERVKLEKQVKQILSRKN